MLKIHFTAHFFLKILQRNSKFVTPHTLKMVVLIWRHLWRLHACKKINFILYVFLEILQRYCKLVVLGTLGMPGYALPKWFYQLIENFRVYLQAKKTNFILHAFLEIYANSLFWVLWPCLVTHTPKMIVSTCRRFQRLSACQKYTSSFTFFLEILYFKESCNLTGWKHFGPLLENQNFARYEMVVKYNTSFHFGLFPRKTNDTIFQRKTILVSFWVLFVQILTK